MRMFKDRNESSDSQEAQTFFLLLSLEISHLLCLVNTFRKESQPPKLILGILALVWVQK